MANVLQYQGYIGSVEFDSEDRIFHGRVLGITEAVEAGRRNMTIENWIADTCRKVIEKRPIN